MLERRTCFYLLAALTAVLVTACTSSLRVGIQSTLNTNEGKPLYVMVRSVGGNTFLSEDYDTVAQKLFSFPRDETVLHRESIFPGKTAEFTLPQPEDTDIAIYVFFTKPGENWRVSVRKPLPGDVLLELGSNNIKKMIVRSK
jgi:hypothetical protein